MNLPNQSTTSYSELFQNLQRVMRQLESESISVDELEREVEKAYSLVDVLQNRLNETTVKVDELIRVKEGTQSESKMNTTRESGDFE